MSLPEPFLARLRPLLGTGRTAEALALVEPLLGAPSTGADVHALVVRLKGDLGDPTGAALVLAAARARFPDDPALQFLAADAARRAGDGASAEAGFARALDLAPTFVEAALYLGNLRLERGAHAPALEALDRAAALAPGVPATHANRALALLALGRHAEALEAAERAVRLAPAHGGALKAMARALLNLGRPGEARGRAREACERLPGDAEAVGVYVLALLEDGALSDATRVAEEAVQRAPTEALYWMVLARVREAAGRLPDAAAAYERGLALTPGDAQARLALASLVAFRAGALDTAMDLLQAGLARDPARPELLAYLVELELLRPGEAAVETARRLQPVAGNVPEYLTLVLHALSRVADWRGREGLENALRGALEGLGPRRNPGHLLYHFALFDDPPLLARLATSYSDSLGLPLAPRPAVVAGRRPLAVAYVSADWGEHPVGWSLVELLERHDRGRVRLIGVSIGRREPSATATRLRAACDEFIDGVALGDEALRDRLRERNVDVVVDLMGHTAQARPGLLARRPAAVQVSYLGYAGTQGAPWIDYLLADATVVPDAAVAHYREAIVRLPVSFFPSDTTDTAADTIEVTRAAQGLADEALVLCAFVQPSRHTPAVFDVWLEWLGSCPRAVLWLQGGATAASHLRARAAAAGVDPARLVFAARVPSRAEHLARHRLADLFLDVYPYNAHSTARDALWMGLPVLSCAGRSFASRVGASLLAATGLPELVAEGLDDYRARGHALLAGDGRALPALRQRLINVRAAPLFDTARLAAEVEWASEAMRADAAAGGASRVLAVPRGGHGAGPLAEPVADGQP